MQIYDILMLVVLGGATLFGLFKGLAWQIASLASLVVSYFMALRFADRVAPLVSEHEPWNRYVAMLIIYAGTSFLIWMVFRLVSGAIDRVKLKEFDHQMGALVGFAKGVLFCMAITFFAVTLLGQEQRDRILASRSGQTIVKFLDKADTVVPPSFHDVIGPYIHKFEQRMDPNYQPQPPADIEQLQQLWQSSQQARGAAAWPNSAAANGPPPPGANQPQQPASPRPGPTPAWPISGVQ